MSWCTWMDTTCVLWAWLDDHQFFREGSFENDAPAPFHLERILVLPFVGRELYSVNSFLVDLEIIFRIGYLRSAFVSAGLPLRCWGCSVCLSVCPASSCGIGRDHKILYPAHAESCPCSSWRGFLGFMWEIRVTTWDWIPWLKTISLCLWWINIKSMTKAV